MELTGVFWSVVGWFKELHIFVIVAHHLRDIYLWFHRVRFVRDFGKYCDSCRRMLWACDDHTKIFTIQTPVKPAAILGGDKQFTKYLRATIAKLIKTNVKYYRLVVL